jgi:hypothetical protein
MTAMAAVEHAEQRQRGNGTPPGAGERDERGGDGEFGERQQCR